PTTMKVNKRSVYHLALVVTMLFLYSCEDKGTNNNPIIYAYFEVNDQIVSADEPVNYTDKSLGTPTEWQWTFEGGTPATSTEQNPTVVYETSGSYKVTLSVSNGTETSVKEKEGFVSVISADYFKQNLMAYFPFVGSAND